ncbi:MAG: hypothetical protein LQ338_001330 [Usnochroma carphineum]|nr:MAG: hypothetical protein LQ338_001330 [Usnochroma carphineum]
MRSRSSSLSPPPLKRRRVTPPEASSCTLAAPPPIPELPPPDPSNDHRTTTLRIYSWNINGIAPYLDTQRPITTFFPTSTSSPRKPGPSPPYPSLRACLHRWSFPHIICLQEVKVAPSDTTSQASVRRIINIPFANNEPTTEPSRLYDSYFCLPRDKYNATGFGGKVYGVCTIIRHDIVPSSRTKTVDWDLEGRVLITEFSNHGLVIFNIYAVNGTTNPYRDPSTGKVIGDRHMRKRTFHTELCDECARYEARGWKVVVAGDLNISQAPLDSYPQLRLGKEHVQNRQHFKECFVKRKEEGGLGMRDTFREVRGMERKYTYRPRGRVWGEGMDRVDLILASQGLTVSDADILDEEVERGRSDHVPLWVEVEVGGSNEDEGPGKKRNRNFESGGVEESKQKVETR